MSVRVDGHSFTCNGGEGREEGVTPPEMIPQPTPFPFPPKPPSNQIENKGLIHSKFFSFYKTNRVEEGREQGRQAAAGIGLGRGYASVST